MRIQSLRAGKIERFSNIIHDRPDFPNQFIIAVKYYNSGSAVQQIDVSLGIGTYVIECAERFHTDLLRAQHGCRFIHRPIIHGLALASADSLPVCIAFIGNLLC